MITRAIRAISIAIMVTSICLVSVILTANAAAVSGVIVHGFVFDRDHQVVANATVTLLKDEAVLPTSSNPALTDTNGYYAFWGIGRGQYCLVASKGPHSISNTILVQDWDVMQNFTLLATSAELAGPTATPVPAVTPTAIPLPDNATAPTPAAAPGFGLPVLLSGIAAATTLAGINKR